MSVLVIGCPLGDFRVEKGNRQGDSPTSFLFHILVEGLSGLTPRVIEIGAC